MSSQKYITPLSHAIIWGFISLLFLILITGAISRYGANDIIFATGYWMFGAFALIFESVMLTYYWEDYKKDITESREKVQLYDVYKELLSESKEILVWVSIWILLVGIPKKDSLLVLFMFAILFLSLIYSISFYQNCVKILSERWPEKKMQKGNNIAPFYFP